MELPRAGGYRVIADFQPKGGAPLVLGADLAVSGHYIRALTGPSCARVGGGARPSRHAGAVHSSRSIPKSTRS
ncbi:hypothetical protein SGPA1_21625 [Streptomyces misionensis JCM 4497]